MNKERKKEVKEAAALRYSPDQSIAPVIVASGKGKIAENIVNAAKESDVPVYVDKSLAHTLNALHIGDEIPRELYEVVAQILIFVSDIDTSYGEIHGTDKK